MVMCEDIPQKSHRRNIHVAKIQCRNSYRLILVIFMFLISVGMFGCASKPQSTPAPSKQEIRNDADRFFEKLDHEKMNDEKDKSSP